MELIVKQDLQRIEYVTRHFAELQGLRILPFALYLVAGALYDATWGYRSHATIGMTVLWLTALAAGVAYLRLGDYYRREFGQVQPRVEPGKQRVSMALFVAFLLLNFALAAADRATGQSYHTQIMIAWWAALALLLLALWGLSGSRLGWPRRFSLWPIVILLATGLWSLPGSPSQQACYPNGFNSCVAIDLLVALLVVAGGLYNHRLLVQSVQPLPLENYE